MGQYMSYGWGNLQLGGFDPNQPWDHEIKLEDRKGCTKQSIESIAGLQSSRLEWEEKQTLKDIHPSPQTAETEGYHEKIYDIGRRVTKGRLRGIRKINFDPDRKKWVVARYKDEGNGRGEDQEPLRSKGKRTVEEFSICIYFNA